MNQPPTSPRYRIASPAPFGYRPGLDGMRGLAVAAVFLYHADVSWMPGGFLGVDTFFVLSGYLITALLVNEWWAQGRISIGDFWKRRARRLLPAVYGLLTAVVAMALVFREHLDRVLGEVPSAVLYVYNWMLIGAEESYFESMGRPSPLRHLWSLAVEEQFYLLWPVVALWALRKGGRRRLVEVAAVGAVVSTALMVLRHVPGTDPSSVYYGTDARAVGLLLGAAGAIVWHPGRTVGTEHRRAVTAVGAAGLVGLVWALLNVDEFDAGLYPGGFLLVGVTSLVVAVAAADPRNGIARLMGTQPLRWVGTRSYSIYLWHWPVVVFTRPGIDMPFDGAAAVLARLALTLALAEMSYRLVEARFRWSPDSVPAGWDGPPTRLVPRGVRALAGAGALASTLALAVTIGWITQPGAGGAVEELPLAFGATTDTIELADFSGTVDIEDSSHFLVEDAERTAVTPPATAPLDPEPTAGGGLVGREPTSTSTTTTTTTQPVADATLAVSAASDAGDALAQASTTTTTTAPPTTTTTVAPLSVTAVGDSVMAGAVAELEAAYEGPIRIDAEVSRSIGEGVDVIAHQAEDKTLGDVVVVHLGTNGPIEVGDVARIMEVAGSDRQVAFLTVKLPRRWESQVNDVLASEVPAYPNAVLVDWHGASEGKREWFSDDGIHIHAKPGAAAYAELVATAVDQLDG